MTTPRPSRNGNANANAHATNFEARAAQRTGAAPPQPTKRAGSNARMSTQLAAPSTISSATAAPVAGALRMPQHEWPEAMKAPSTIGTRPRMGAPSGELGRWQACPRTSAHREGSGP